MIPVGRRLELSHSQSKTIFTRGSRIAQGLDSSTDWAVQSYRSATACLLGSLADFFEPSFAGEGSRLSSSTDQPVGFRFSSVGYLASFQPKSASSSAHAQGALTRRSGRIVTIYVAISQSRSVSCRFARGLGTVSPWILSG